MSMEFGFYVYPDGDDPELYRKAVVDGCAEHGYGEGPAMIEPPTPLDLAAAAEHLNLGRAFPEAQPTGTADASPVNPVPIGGLWSIERIMPLLGQPYDRPDGPPTGADQ